VLLVPPTVRQLDVVEAQPDPLVVEEAALGVGLPRGRRLLAALPGWL
jgi:hypothetical protein